MFNSRPAVLFFLCATLLAGGSALADDYTVPFGEPITGSSLRPGRVGLGIKVSVDKSWEQLNQEERLAWRGFTELIDPSVTPPFPLPNIRGFLRKLSTHDRFAFTDTIERTGGLFLVVRLSEKGDVKTVEIMEGADGAKSLTENEKELAFVYVTALLATKFSPALLDGKPVPSAFPMRIGSKFLMK